MALQRARPLTRLTHDFIAGTRKTQFAWTPPPGAALQWLTPALLYAWYVQNRQPQRRVHLSLITERVAYGLHIVNIFCLICIVYCALHSCARVIVKKHAA